MKPRRLRPVKPAANVKLARPILIRVAKKGGCITYKDLLICMEGHPGMSYIGEVLDRIDELEGEARRPALSAVVVRVDTGMVSGGFFRLLNTPSNLLRTSPEEWRDYRLSAADRNYWQKQLACVHKYWQSLDSC